MILHLFLSTVPTAQTTPPTLTVHARGFQDSAGQAVAKLFFAGDNVRGRGRLEQTVQIKDGRARFRFQGLPPGACAVVVFHDRNGNGVIDHYPILRVPSEPLGFSNGFALGPGSGLPTFEKLRFELPEGGADLDITVK